MVVQPLFKLIVSLVFLSDILHGILGKRKRKKQIRNMKKKLIRAPFLLFYSSDPRARPISSLPSSLPRVGRRPALGPGRRSSDCARPSPSPRWRVGLGGQLHPPHQISRVTSRPRSACWSRRGRPGTGKGTMWGAICPHLRAVPSSPLPHRCSSTACQRPQRAAGAGFPPAP
jgi:hypothetical protein